MYILIILQKNKITTVCIMSQKLIRLTCESNDGIFNGKFDQDVEIKKGSDIAFKSLTLERASDNFIVNSSNQSFNFSSTGYPPQSQTGVITNGTYEQDDTGTLMNNITNAMNKVCSMTAVDGLGANLNQMNLQWRASVDENEDTVEIECKRSLFFPLSQWNVSEALYNTEFVRNAPIIQGVTDATEVTQTTEAGLGRDDAGPAGVLNESYMFTAIPFIKSTGAFRVRLGSMTVGTDDRPAATIGLTDAAGLTKLRNATITLEDLLYAIRVDQPSASATQGGYSFINKKGSATTTAVETGGNLVKPENYDVDDTSANDMFEIRLDNNSVIGSIFQETVAIKNLLPSLPLAEGIDLYPVVFFHMDINTVTLDMVQVSLDPFGNPDDFPNQIVRDNPQLEDSTNSTLTGPVKFETTSLGIPYTPQVNMNLALANYLGYKNGTLIEFAGVDNFVSKGGLLTKQIIPNLFDPISGGTYNLAIGFKIKAVTVITNAINGDSYLVDTQTFTLDSFDSYGLSKAERDANSGGSRRNLLAVIPVVEQPIVNSSTTRVQYEPNTLDYIAIKNKSDVITRQIKMRLLNSRYENVITAGMATMSILIRDPTNMDA